MGGLSSSLFSFVFGDGGGFEVTATTRITSLYRERDIRSRKSCHALRRARYNRVVRVKIARRDDVDGMVTSLSEQYLFVRIPPMTPSHNAICHLIYCTHARH